MRMALEGKITLTLYPPDYESSESLWSSHPELNIISELLGTNLETEDAENPEDSLHDESDEDEDNISDSEDNSTPTISNKFGALESYLEND